MTLIAQHDINYWRALINPFVFALFDMRPHPDPSPLQEEGTKLLTMVRSYITCSLLSNTSSPLQEGGNKFAGCGLELYSLPPLGVKGQGGEATDYEQNLRNQVLAAWFCLDSIRASLKYSALRPVTAALARHFGLGGVISVNSNIFCRQVAAIDREAALCNVQVNAD